MITQEIISRAYSYVSYRELINHLVAENKTSGEKQTPARIEFTNLNIHRMNRLDKTIQLQPELVQTIQKMKCKQTWLVLSEPWCGDSAQIIPSLEKMAISSIGKIELKILFRDENPLVMDCVLTNGTRSVPKIIAVDSESLEMLGTWGPRPNPAQQIMLHWKANQDKISWDDFEKELHTWYAHDKSQTIQKEFISVIEEWTKILC